MLPVEIKKNVFWVGAVDFGCRNFHGYSVAPTGSSYNCYVIKDKKNVLFDTVQAHKTGTLLDRLAQVLEHEKIDYLVLNHLELDHAGALQEIVSRCKPEKIFCSVMGQKVMERYFDTRGWPVQAVKTGDVVNIGSRNIHFVETRMLHWPDSMFSYIPEDKLLISNDAFGQNIASSELYADQHDPADLDLRVREYYYNIVLPFSPQVLKTLELVEQMKLDIDLLAPDHGLIFRSKNDVTAIFNKYREMALQKPQKRALIFYDTMWHSTETLAYAVADGLGQAGVPHRIMFLKNHHHSEIMTELSGCGAVIAGSPTHNNGIMPLVGAALCYMRGLRPQNRIGAAFGSFGWSGESIKVISQFLTDMKMEQPCEGVKCSYKPAPEDLLAATQLGKAVGEALVQKMPGKLI
jgi:flavorubredoxin